MKTSAYIRKTLLAGLIGAFILSVGATPTMVWAQSSITLSADASSPQVAPPASVSRSMPHGGVVPDACVNAPTAKQLGGWTPWHTGLYANDFGSCAYYHDANIQLRQKPRPARLVVFIGDSITEMWKQDDPDFFTDDRVDRGISGQTSSQMLVRFREDVIDLQPRVVHIMGGINDIAGNTGVTTLHVIEGNLADMANLARAHGIKVVMGSLLPTTRIPWQTGISPTHTVQQLNRWIEHYARVHHIAYADYYDAMTNSSGGMNAGLSADGVHPTLEGFKLMDPIAQRAIRRSLTKPDGK